MSKEQLSALLAKLKADEGLHEKFKGATDLDAAVAIAREAGFDVSKDDLIEDHSKQMLELSDQDLEGLAGGNPFMASAIYYTICAWLTQDVAPK